jgi:hypothetical protein
VRGRRLLCGAGVALCVVCVSVGLGRNSKLLAVGRGWLRSFSGKLRPCLVSCGLNCFLVRVV